MNDTNAINQLINAAIMAKGSSGGSTMAVVNAILVALGPILAAFVLLITTRSTRMLDKIHTEVNHDRTVMMEELRKLRESVTDLTGRNKTLEEHKRGTEMATAVAAATPSPVAAPSHPLPNPVFTPEQMAQIKIAINESQKGN